MTQQIREKFEEFLAGKMTERKLRKYIVENVDVQTLYDFIIEMQNEWLDDKISRYEYKMIEKYVTKFDRAISRNKRKISMEEIPHDCPNCWRRCSNNVLLYDTKGLSCCDCRGLVKRCLHCKLSEEDYKTWRDEDDKMWMKFSFSKLSKEEKDKELEKDKKRVRQLAINLLKN
jgi:hypothetical protein|tara:strand:- start:799 stop:1317 length:519 start_codon:yes stop_codon:yes gene_type:complete